MNKTDVFRECGAVFEFAKSRLVLKLICCYPKIVFSAQKFSKQQTTGLVSIGLALKICDSELQRLANLLLLFVCKNTQINGYS